LPTRSGVWIVVGSVSAGLFLTILAGSEPGYLLGAFLIVGTLSAALSVQPTAVHLIIPVPALAYLAASMIAGYIHDRPVDTSHTALAISALQWVAGGFIWMTIATLLAIVITAIRKPTRRRGRGSSVQRQSADRSADWY
jgi:hypothetical protein